MDSKKKTEILPVDVGNAKKLLFFKIFEKDKFLLFAFKKTERIVSAIYLVSNFLPESEPVKWKLRETSVTVVSRILSLTSGGASQTEIISEINADFLTLLFLLDVSFTAGFISEMNYSILKKELEHMLETLCLKDISEGVGGDKKVSFDKEFFALSEDFFVPKSQGDPSPNLPYQAGQDGIRKAVSIYEWPDIGRAEDAYKRQSKGRNFIKDKVASSIYPLSSGFKQGADNDYKGQSVDGKSGKEVNNSRQARILSVFQDNRNNLSVKDFSLNIKDCSEKTIQRELLSLVKLGVLKKVGERRWSRYSLAS